MSDTVDPVTRTLTGGVPLILLAAAALTWPVAMGLLALYKRAVRRSMRAQAHGAASGGVAPAPEATQTERRLAAMLQDAPLVPPGAAANALFERLRTRPLHAGLVYALA